MEFLRLGSKPSDSRDKVPRAIDNKGNAGKNVSLKSTHTSSRGGSKNKISVHSYWNKQTPQEDLKYSDDTSENFCAHCSVVAAVRTA